MAGRKRNADPSLLTTGELAVAVNLSPRNVILLCERGDLPIVSGGGGSGQHRLLDVAGFARAVVISAFANAGLPMSEGVKVANAIWSRRSRQLPKALANYMFQQELTSCAFANQPEDIFATVYDGRHLIITQDDSTIRSHPNYMADQSNQTLKRYYIEPQIAGSADFSDKQKFFDYLLEHAMLRVKINISQALRRAALQMRITKMI
jgi:hypothetical protein